MLCRQDTLFAARPDRNEYIFLTFFLVSIYNASSVIVVASYLHTTLQIIHIKIYSSIIITMIAIRDLWQAIYVWT